MIRKTLSHSVQSVAEFVRDMSLIEKKFREEVLDCCSTLAVIDCSFFHWLLGALAWSLSILRVGEFFLCTDVYHLKSSDV